jgi:phage terminase large subunit-like protein
MSAPIGDRDYAYSRCQACDTENAPFATNGPVATEEQNWATYVCGGAGRGSGKEGCGANWSVTTAAGIAHNEALGHHTIGRFPQDVHRGRFISAPSEAYRANYDRIFGKKGARDGQDEPQDG